MKLFAYLSSAEINQISSTSQPFSLINVPLEETIQILAKKAFNGNWFNNIHNLNICEGDPNQAAYNCN